MQRKPTRKISVGSVSVGGNSPISLQSMTSTYTHDINNTIKQIQELEGLGCDIIRVAIPDERSAKALCEIKKGISIPIIGDIHFDYKLAIMAIEQGRADGIRINPGNIGSLDKIKAILDKAKEYQIPVRIGINSGSLEKDILLEHGKANANALVESALKNIRIFEKLNFKNFKISIKSSEVLTTINAYKMLSDVVDYPLHLGITEAGTSFSGTIKSAVGIGALLSEGIGDTIRVSLTDHPREEIRVGLEILKALGLRKDGVEIISCPTCGRCNIDLVNIAKEVQKKTSTINKNIKIAIMGCVVNGPGEAKEADIGVAGGSGVGVIFKKGKIIKKIKEDEIVEELLKQIEKFAIEK
ncbi:MAG TPA: flavodoxin-dependent (E)-4-hydroxy-3-methylbut-2-enyl-diphosphate synthase [Thermoanaerobacterales bacterium]|nr:flavodoxin-dependent (E)-4-hydroxy-3-methylbut-2-enyl-diphosphate synthase [Thermoanaerobacterales bacterium]